MTFSAIEEASILIPFVHTTGGKRYGQYITKGSEDSVEVNQASLNFQRYYLSYLNPRS